jgi:hypothetical protein
MRVICAKNAERIEMQFDVESGDSWCAQLVQTPDPPGEGKLWALWGVGDLAKHFQWGNVGRLIFRQR